MIELDDQMRRDLALKMAEDWGKSAHRVMALFDGDIHAQIAILDTALSAMVAALAFKIAIRDGVDFRRSMLEAMRQVRAHVVRKMQEGET